MISIENSKPKPQKILDFIDKFERCCMGEIKLTPSLFHEINMEISIGAVLMIGKRRYEKNSTGRHLIWRGVDNNEYDLGPIHSTNIVRDYPGFHAKRTLSLGDHHVIENQILTVPGKRKHVTSVTLKDGSTGVGPNYRTALRNAILKMHIKEQENRFKPIKFASKLLSFLF